MTENKCETFFMFITIFFNIWLSFDNLKNGENQSVYKNIEDKGKRLVKRKHVVELKALF